MLGVQVGGAFDGVPPYLSRGKKRTGNFRSCEWSDKPDTNFDLNSRISIGYPVLINGPYFF